MKIHCIQHVEFETMGTIVEWIAEKNHSLSTTHLYDNPKFPSVDDFDLLVIMGGPMNIYEYEKYPWLRDEKGFIKYAISAGKSVLGICLGAQLVADVLGAKVSKNKYKEIGWFPVFATRQVRSENMLLNGIPEKLIAFHWHGDTFDLPEEAAKLFESEACKNQGFAYKNRVIALQFHLEMSNRTIENVIKNCKDELIEGTYVQSEAEMLDKDTFLKESKLLMFRILDNLEGVINQSEPGTVKSQK